MTPSAKPTTTDEYIAALDEPAAARMRELRALAQDAAPEASEAPGTSDETPPAADAP